jgi:DNA-directed RNA polymerase specialized sigma subunit
MISHPIAPHLEILEFWVNQFTKNPAHLEDLFQAGVVGLLLAYKSHNPAHENFRTHAKFYVFRELRRERRFLNNHKKYSKWESN